jgi:succinate dehydrogenase/fumarate reductase flavoprotein subunit
VTGADVVVLGSGAAGLTAAIAAHDAGARVVVVEKGDVVGGTTALSGGAVWVPGNHRQAEAGIVDRIEDGFRYLMSLSHGLVEERLVRTLVETGPRVIERLEQVTPLRFRVVPGFPDYQSEHPGSMPGGGRSLEAELFPFVDLGQWADRVARPARLLDLYLHETPTGGGSGIVPDDVRAVRAERDERGIGQALVGGLLRACLDRGIEPRLGTAARRLVVEKGGVAGAELEGGEVVRASRAVVLATGGFEFDPDLVRSFLRGPMLHPPGIETNTGDGLRMAMRVGASLGNMREAWWVPVMRVPADDGSVRSQLVLRERTLPRSVMVNRRGERFTDEAANYNALGSAFHAFEPTTFDYPNIPAWLVVDSEYLRRYGLGPLPPGGDTPAWITSRSTLRELAQAIGIDPDGLQRTIAAFNADVAGGQDTRFRRGESAHDRWAGDRSLDERARTLGQLDTPPFHGIEIHSSCLGTNGGPRTDEHARVLDVDGEVVEGLYAAGNVMAGVTGMTYGGAGGTLGPAVTFGWIAGEHAARGAP